MSVGPKARDLAQALIRCPSVTPEDGGSLDTLQAALEPLGFTCHRLTFSDDNTPDVQNMYARIGAAAPNFCFAGHTDVVPVGDTAGWTTDPFGAEIIDGVLYGRGATDMKTAIACFAEAAARFLARNGKDFNGSISLLITGDEEGPAINGTRKVLQWMQERGETLDACLVGEPTNPATLGEMVKIGRRGSLSGFLEVHGIQGHTAYPHLADNPLPRLVKMLAAITDEALDNGTGHFQPSNLQITTIDVGNTATNIIPGNARAAFNVRFNDTHTSESLMAWLRDRFDAVGGDYDVEFHITGDAFLTAPGPFSDLMSRAVERVTGIKPDLSTTGGTSDARFIKDFCPVAEFGLISQSMHKVDERVAITDLENLTDIYETVLDGYFAS
ncbi:MAG: succinyl-diaminopimelate desuccinylase [Proteobacteria bacterium]|nr:succinyl-diaminopimelate desuccinylase [Pseudomonadota bacterium]MDA1323609.1 succinyl-diaminopimelate desuccinylase [Pseudomonadota bacterium]